VLPHQAVGPCAWTESGRIVRHGRIVELSDVVATPPPGRGLLGIEPLAVLVPRGAWRRRAPAGALALCADGLGATAFAALTDERRSG